MKLRFVLSLFITASVSTSAGCAGTSDATEPSVAAATEAEADDITVVSAQARYDTVDSDGGVGATPFDTSRCAPLDADAVDCTTELARMFGVPALHQVRVPRAGFRCSVLRVTTATRSAAMPSAVAIGFHYAGALGGDGRAIRTADLVAKGSGTLKTGDPVTLHEFVGLANCWLGSASSSQSARYTFKPYRISRQRRRLSQLGPVRRLRRFSTEPRLRPDHGDPPLIESIRR